MRRRPVYSTKRDQILNGHREGETSAGHSARFNIITGDKGVFNEITVERLNVEMADDGAVNANDALPGQLITGDAAPGEAIWVDRNTVPLGDFGGILAAEKGGTGQDLSGATGALEINSGVISTPAQLSVAKGGTGASSHTSGNFLQGNGTAAVTAIKAVPAGAVVGTTDVQILTNKTIDLEAGSNTITGTLSAENGGTNTDLSSATGAISVSGGTFSAGTLQVAQGGSGATSFTSGQLLTGAGTGAVSTTPVPSGGLVGTSETQTLSNKTFIDASTTFQDDATSDKQFRFQASGISAATTRTYTVPDEDTTLVGTDATQTLTNKTFNVQTGNTIAGSLGVPNGGLGRTTLADGGLLIGNGTLSVQTASPSAANQVYLSTAANVASWQSASGLGAQTLADLSDYETSTLTYRLDIGGTFIDVTNGLTFTRVGNVVTMTIVNSNLAINDHPGGPAVLGIPPGLGAIPVQFRPIDDMIWVGIVWASQNGGVQIGTLTWNGSSFQLFRQSDFTSVNSPWTTVGVGTSFGLESGISVSYIV